MFVLCSVTQIDLSEIRRKDTQNANTMQIFYTNFRKKTPKMQLFSKFLQN